ncbi:Regulator of chromosome condensation (RCC1) repeat protein [compost metagenome]
MKKLIFLTILFSSQVFAQAPRFIELKSINSSVAGNVVLIASTITKLTDPNSELYLESSFAGSALKIRKFTEGESASISPALTAQQSYNWQVKAYLQDRTRVQQLQVSIIEMEREIIDLTKMLDREGDVAKRTLLENAILEAEQRKLTYKTQIVNSRKLVETKNLEVIGPMAKVPKKNLLNPLEISLDRYHYIEGQTGTANIVLHPEYVYDYENLSFELETTLDEIPIYFTKIAENSFRATLSSAQLTLGTHGLGAYLYTRDKKDSSMILEVIDKANLFKTELFNKIQYSSGAEQAYYQKEYDEVNEIRNVFLNFHLLMRSEVFRYVESFWVNTDNLTFTKIRVGYSSTCGIRGGGLYCWGANTFGELGQGNTIGIPKPTGVTQFSSGVTDIATGGSHMCAIHLGALYCWGDNRDGQLGNVTNISSSVPVLVNGMTSGVTQVAAGMAHTCAVKSGVVYCWGLNEYGSLGAGTGSTNSPRAVTLAGTINVLSAGGFSTCAVTTVNLNSRVYCWGFNNRGQLGDGTLVNKFVPTVVPAITSLAEYVSVGDTTTCAVVSGAAKCWGANTNGMLGNGNATNSSVPVNVTSFTSGVSRVEVGGTSTCGIKSSSPYCWGTGTYGALGTGNTTSRNVPTAIVGHYSLSMSVGFGSACMIDFSGDGKCWGINRGGNLGNNTTSGDQWSPVAVVKPIPMFVENHKVHY